MCPVMSQYHQFQYRPCPLPPRENPNAFDFFENFWSNSLVCWQFRWSKMPALQKASNSPPTMCEISYSNIIILLNTTQGGVLREGTKNDHAADKIQSKYLYARKAVLRRFVHFNKIVHSRKPTFDGLFKGSQTLQQNSEYRRFGIYFMVENNKCTGNIHSV